MAKGKMFCRLLLLVSLAVSGCGYSADHAIDSHQQAKATYSELNVVKGSVYTTTDKVVSLHFNKRWFKTLTPDQRKNFNIADDHIIALNQPGFLDDDNNFYFNDAVTDATLFADFDGYTLYSFFQGLPIPKTDVTITQNWDWHGDSNLTLHVDKEWPLSTISINPFSNLAYWIGGGEKGTYASYSKARAKIDNDLGFSPALPPCWFEVKLCKDHLAFLDAGNTISVTGDLFTIKRGNTICTGEFRNYTANMKLCP